MFYRLTHITSAGDSWKKETFQFCFRISGFSKNIMHILSNPDIDNILVYIHVCVTLPILKYILFREFNEPPTEGSLNYLRCSLTPILTTKKFF